MGNKRNLPLQRHATRKSRRLFAKNSPNANEDGMGMGAATELSGSGCDNADDYLDNFINSTRNMLRNALPHAVAHQRTSYNSANNASTQSCFDDALMSAEAQWSLRISNLPCDFFTCEEAKLLHNNLESNRSAKPLSYRALLLDDKVLLDLKEYFESQVEPHSFRSQCLNSYKNLKSCLGQLMRYACAVGRTDPTKLHRSGELFKASTDEKVLRAFILGMQTRCSATTVCNKASVLLKWVKFSSVWYAKGNRPTEKGKCDAVGGYLRTTASAEKREARRSTRNLKNPLERLRLNKVLLEDDFYKAQDRAEDCLRGILSTAHRLFQQRRSTQMESQKRIVFELLARSNGVLMKKWGLNFLNLIVLHGSGQRAQVYAEIDLEAFAIGNDGTLVQNTLELKRLAQNTGYFYLQTAFEKRQRSSKMPYIRLPVSILDIFLFHRSFARPAILKRANMSEEGRMREVLLLNTETGAALSSKQICASVRAFFKRIDPQLGPITPLVLRRSFATIMFHRYLRGEIHKEKTRGQFLDFLAERLNTSAEQLEESYCADEHVQDAVNRLFSEE